MNESLKVRILEIAKIYANKKLIFVSGNFNILHPGFMRLLNFAKNCGEVLIVGLHENSEDNVLIEYETRQEGLQSIQCVDQVVPIKESYIEEILRLLKPYGVVKGAEHNKSFNPEKKILDTYGGHLFFSSSESKFSHVELLKEELTNIPINVLSHDHGYLIRHGINPQKLISYVDKFTTLSAITLGELIVDEYIHCEALGMSREDPTLVITPVKIDKFIGGAAIVSSHVAKLGAQSNFLTASIRDNNFIYAQTQLDKFFVNTFLFEDQSRPTTVKQRFRANNKTLLRVNNLVQHEIEELFIQRITSCLIEKISDSNILIFSDFNYGCLPKLLIDEVSALCKAHNIPYIADSQASSQRSNIARYKDAKLIAATEYEARLATNDFTSGIQYLASRLIENANAEYLLLKLGPEGVLVCDHSGNVDILRAFNKNPIDVAGAGDAMLATAGLAIASGATLWEAAYLASIGSAIQIGRIGNIPIDPETIKDHLKHLIKNI